MASPEAVYQETVSNFPVIMLLMFMVAGIYFMRDMLLFTFTRILLGVKSKTIVVPVLFRTGAVLSAFLDALTVTAVLITIRLASTLSITRWPQARKLSMTAMTIADDQSLISNHRQNLEDFRAFLRSLIMHGAVGTALGGVMTLVGEPQNLLIAERAELGLYGILLAYGASDLACFCLWPDDLCATGKNKNSWLRRHSSR